MEDKVIGLPVFIQKQRINIEINKEYDNMEKTVTTHLIDGKSKKAEFVFISKMGHSMKLND